MKNLKLKILAICLFVSIGFQSQAQNRYNSFEKYEEDFLADSLLILDNYSREVTRTSILTAIIWARIGTEVEIATCSETIGVTKYYVTAYFVEEDQSRIRYSVNKPTDKVLIINHYDSTDRYVAIVGPKKTFIYKEKKD